MRRRLSRREFYRNAARHALAGGVACASSDAALAVPPVRSPGASGVLRISRNPKALDVPPTAPPGETWRYMLSYPFQVAPRLAALACNLKQNYGPGQDYEGGIDIILFDDHRRISTGKAIVVTRNHEEANPKAAGKPAVMVKYPGQAGFVPFGAKRKNGAPHPHAGTGFITSRAHGWPVDDSEYVVDFPDRKGRGAFRGEKQYAYFEYFPLSFDGRQLKLGANERLADEEILPGWKIVGAGITNPISDGDDLLMGMQGARPGRGVGSGMIRWSRKGGTWRPVAFDLITPEDNSLEPSLIRDIDGSLLFCARGKRETGPPIRIWRSRDGGGKWDQILFLNGMVGSVPIALCQAVDGTPYIASNIKTQMIQVPNGDGGISRLEPKGGRGERSTLCLWPLNEARNGLECPLIARDPFTELGVPPHGTVWAVDHPSSMTVQLEDGDWHNVLGYRILEWMENTHFISPALQTGGYVEEVISIGKPIPIWNF